MEARATFGGSSISKSFVAIVLVIVALGLGLMGGYVAKSLTGSAAATSTQTGPVHPAPGTVLRQDWEQQAQPAAPQRTRPIRHS